MDAVEDLMAALIVHLKAQSIVSDIAAQRVFGMELPPEEAESMPRHAVVLQPAGGASPGYTTTLPLNAMRVDAFSYGPTAYEARRLSRAVRAVMKGIERTKVGTVLLHWATPAGGLVDERDPQARWPRVFESFSIMGSEQGAT